MPITIRASRSMRRMLALPVVLGASVVAMSAQTDAQATVTPATQSSEAATGSTYNFQLPVHLDLPAFSSSSSSVDVDEPSTGQVVAANTADHFSFLNAQYGRQRYGRPRYRSGNTNEDGSEKYTFFVGGGFTQPLGNTFHYLTPSWGVQVGGGRNFSKNFGIMAQFDWDNFGFNSRTLTAQQALYNQLIAYYNATQSNPNNQISPISGLDGHTHVLSFTLDPVYTLSSRQEGLNAYVVGGVGFYHKVADFTVPTTGYYYDPYSGGYYQYQSNQTFDHYFSNAPGFNGGFGLTYKFSHFSNERLYGEVRYVYIVTSQRQGLTVFNVTAANQNNPNDFPANSNRTSYVPVKFGLRF